MTELYLGKVCFSNGVLARLQPVAAWTAGRWDRLSASALTGRFPPEGKVVALRGEVTSAQDNSVWTFSIKANSRTDKDRFMTDNAERAMPVVDLRSWSLEEARRVLFGPGVQLPAGTDGRVVVMLSEGLMTHLELDIDKAFRRWQATPTVAPIALSTTPDWLSDVPEVDGWRYLPSTRVLTWDEVRKVDWSRDDDFVANTINRFRRLTRHLTETEYALPAKNAVQYVARALREAGTLAGEPDIEQNLERLRAQWPQLERSLLAADELVRQLLTTKAAQAAIEEGVRARVESELSTMRPELEAKARRDIEAELAELTRKRDEARDEASRAEIEIRTANRDLYESQRKCREAREALAELRTDVAAELDALRMAFESVSPMELPYARAIVARLDAAVAGVAGEGQTLLPSALPPWACGRSAKAHTRVEPGPTLVARLKEEATGHGVNEQDLLLIDGFARAGELVFLTGRAAERALAAYARTVSGGRVRTMALDASVIGLDDLWRVPGSQLPTALAHAWSAAQADPSVAVVLCLRGIESTASKEWLLGLTATLRSNVRPSNLLTLALASPGLKSAGEVGALPELARAVVALNPRDDAHAALRLMNELGATRAASTVLHCRPGDAELPGDLLALAAEGDRDPTTLVRAVTVYRALRQTSADLASSQFFAQWVGVVEGGPVERLPEPVKTGYLVLASACLASIGQ